MTKNAEFDAVSDGQILRVRIDYDGEMTILSPVVDLEYEIAYAAMGGRKSPELLFTEEWEETPIKVFLGKMSHSAILTRQRYLIALDWVEHVIPIYTAQFPNKQQQFMDLIEDARKLLHHGNLLIAHVPDQVWKLKEQANHWASLNKSWAAFYEISALFSLLKHDLVGSANAAATAMSHHADPTRCTAEFNRAYETERLWQIRRIIDVVNALDRTKKRKNAPKNWPPLGATP